MSGEGGGGARPDTGPSREGGAPAVGEAVGPAADVREPGPGGEARESVPAERARTTVGSAGEAGEPVPAGQGRTPARAPGGVLEGAGRAGQAREPPAGSPLRRVRIRVEGTVQGVGFRPFVHRLATSLGLSGWVRNGPPGVLIEPEGSPSAVTAFLDRLVGEAPPLATVERVTWEELPAVGEVGFLILESAGADGRATLVLADSATCDDCLRELRDPGDRRYRYPFINCTNCGPRFTIVRSTPYDRPRTTMAAFEMCGRCRAEYEDPADRRFHAQPNACPACGPAARLVDASGRAAEGSYRGAGPGAGASVEGPHPDVVMAAATALREGRILAVKGLGGFHLACLATDQAAVSTLRSRKHREDRPFALMVPDRDAAARLVELRSEEEALLAGRERPIVLAPRRDGTDVAPAVAPGHRDLGVMLPYTPLHHLLLADVGEALVMTSGNVSQEPLAYRDDEALERLAGIADLFLLHDRPIRTRTDDSVVRVVSVAGARRPMMLRRSRGWVPSPVPLPVAAPRPLLAVGGHLKNTFCVVEGGRAWIGPHVGDLENWETLRSFREGTRHLEALFSVEPAVVAHDLHPDYLSTKEARARPGVETVGVQHHHAHLAAALAEHGETGPAVGAVYDGTGWGPGGVVWGGEVLVGGLREFERVAHLHPVRLPGGEAAVEEPWRMACAWLVAAGGGAVPEIPDALAGRVPEERWRAVAHMARSGTAAPLTTSMGRLFDAVAALCGLRLRVTYEGQAAIELEMAVDPREEGCYALPVVPDPGAPPPAPRPAAARAEGDGGPTGAGGPGDPPWILDARPTVRAVVRDVAAGVGAGVVAARFHAAVAAATVEACGRSARERGLDTVVLSGGVFQNVRLLERTSAALAARGLRPLVPGGVPPNDGGLSFGQAAVAAAREAAGPGAETAETTRPASDVPGTGG